MRLLFFYSTAAAADDDETGRIMCYMYNVLWRQVAASVGAVKTVVVRLSATCSTQEHPVSD